PNIEIDGWGLVLWAARQYVDASGDTAWLSAATTAGPSNYDTLVQGIANPLTANLETNGICKADSSIWEVHDQNKKHFAYTTVPAASSATTTARARTTTTNGAWSTTAPRTRCGARDGAPTPMRS